MPLPRSPNKRAALKVLAPFPFILAARSSLRLHSPHHAKPQAHHTPQGFCNPAPDFVEARGWQFALWILRRALHLFFRPEPVVIPRIDNDGSWLRTSHGHDTLTWIGHATCLLQMEGTTILTDPVWARRAGPFTHLGSVRVSDPGLKLEDLPDVDMVVISHNHYDHLDRDAIMRLAARNSRTVFCVPLGLADWMRERGASVVREFDWWDEAVIDGLTVTCTPAQHFSGRGLADRNRTLWAAWSIKGKKKSVFFGGDSGYARFYKEIGQRLGPFDLAVLPIGAYAPRHLMRPIHMDPAEAVQASLDLEAHAMLGTHWGTFQLSDERADDPPKKMEEAVRSRNLAHEHFWTFMVGETRIL